MATDANCTDGLVDDEVIFVPRSTLWPSGTEENLRPKARHGRSSRAFLGGTTLEALEGP